MLGKDHLKISFAFSVPIIIYLIFFVLNFDLSLYIIVVFTMCAIIGSLTPDADCKGKTALYQESKIVHFLMILIYEFILRCTKYLANRYPDQLNPVTEEHRGILHSLFGIFISSFLLSLIILVLMLLLFYITELFYFIDVFYISIFGFFGLLLGQLLHLLEDSCTKSGIKWFFPFPPKLRLHGNIVTSSEIKDRRPKYFAETLGKTGAISSLVIMILWAYNSEFFIYSLLVALIIQSFVFIYLYRIAQSELEGSQWQIIPKELKKKEKKSIKAKKRKG
ncbi:MAG: metal-dependent hydrolase [Methanimicrococcus sp.]|nr:metal-dependent hydrolase [Methanimicrococcus sp.]